MKGAADLAPRICAVAHVAAAVTTLLWIRGGSEAVADPHARAAFIAAHVTGWRIAWLVWMAAAITLIAFLRWWAARCARVSLAFVALWIAIAGLAADFTADALFILWVPSRHETFAPATTFISEVVANGLYSVAGSILMLASPRMSAFFLVWGWAVWIDGLALALCGALRWNAGIVASSALLLALFVPWVWIARDQIERRA